MKRVIWRNEDAPNDCLLVTYTIYAVGVFAFGRALLFDGGAPMLALCANIGAQKRVMSLLPQAKQTSSAGGRVSRVIYDQMGDHPFQAVF